MNKKKAKFSATIQKELDRKLGRETKKEKVEKENIVYARVSTPEQAQKFGIPSQLNLLKDYTEKKKFQVKEENVFSEDETAHGYDPKRSVFTELLKRFKKGGYYRIFVDEQGRLTREPEENASLDNLVRRGVLEIHFVSEKEVYDENAASHDRFKRGLFAQVHRYFVDLQTEKAIRGTIEKISIGEFPGFAPCGYVNNIVTGKIEKDEERWDKVKELWQLAKTGEYSLSDLASVMRAKGLTVRVQRKEERGKREPNLITKKGVEKILSNPFYAGKFKWFGELWSNRGINNDLESTYPIMISWENYEEARKAISGHDRRGKQKKTYEWLYKNILTCHYCGCSLVGFKKKGITYYRCSEGKLNVIVDEKYSNWYEKKWGDLARKETIRKGKKVVRYGCPQNNPNLRGYGNTSWKEVEIDEIIVRAFNELHYNEGIFEWVKEQVGLEAEKKYKEVETEIAGLQKEKKQVEKSLKDLVLSKKNYTDEIELEIYHKELESLKAKLQKIDEDIADLEADRQENIEATVDSLELAAKFTKSFKEKNLKAEEGFDQETKRDMLKIMFRTVWAGDGSRMNLGDTGIIVASEKDGKYNHLKSLGFVWREPFRTLFDVKLLQEISEIETENPKNGQWHARRDLNPRPLDSKSTALSTELRAHLV